VGNEASIDDDGSAGYSRATFCRDWTIIGLFLSQKLLRMRRSHPALMARRLLKNPPTVNPMKHARCWSFLLIFLCLCILPTGSQAQTDTGAASAVTSVPGLEKQIEFWKKIFTEYSLSQLVFFDPLDMGRIYEVLEVGEDNRPQSYIDAERARIAATAGVDVERVQAQRGVKERMLAGLKRSGRYMQHIEQIFRDNDLPTELGYLPLVESSFDINARSFAGAIGMWQFMRATGKEHRLRIDRNIDERRDPLESSRAAASLLKQNYQILGSWPLALTAYNYGAGGMARAIAELQSDNLVELIQNYQHPYWGFAPKNFYAEFVAAVEIAKNMDRYFPGIEPDRPLAVHEMEVKQNSSLIAIAKSTGISHKELLTWNPALTPQIRSVPAGYRLKIPLDSKAEPLVQVATKPEPSPQKQQFVRHRVKRGETILNIARRYGASVDSILRSNGMRKNHLLQAGMTLLIPKF
jgi:membrane-bound lytic murein transglycosylase D